MSRPPEAHDAAKNNLRLFKLYETMLQGQDINEYISCTGKLAVWLGHPKAYYSAARPNIVKLLIIAQQALRVAVQTDTSLKAPFNAAPHLGHPMAPSYVKLLKAIEPFQELFVENHLRTAIATLLQSVAGISPSDYNPPPPPTFTSPQQGIDPTGSSKLTTESQTQAMIDPGPTPIRETTVEFSGAEPLATNTTPKHSISTTSSFLQTQTWVEQNVVKSTSPEIVCLESSKNDPVESPALHASPQAPSTQVSIEKIVSSGNAKKKKKKKIDLTAFVRSDLRDFRQKQAQVLHQASESVHIKKEPETEQIPLGADAGQQTDNADTVVDIAQKLVNQPGTPDARHHPNFNVPDPHLLARGNSSPPPLLSPIPPPGFEGLVPQEPSGNEQVGPKEPLSSTPCPPSTTPELHITTNENPPKCLQEPPPPHVQTRTSKTPLVSNQQAQASGSPVLIRSRPQDKPPSLPQLVVDPLPQRPIASDVHMNSPSVQDDPKDPRNIENSPSFSQSQVAADIPGHQPLPGLTSPEKLELPVSTPTASAQQPTHLHSSNLSLGRTAPIPTPQLDEQESQLASPLRPFIISEDSTLARLFKWYEEYKFLKVTGVSSGDENEPPERQKQEGNQSTASPEGLVEDVVILDQMNQDVFGKELQIVAITKGFSHDTFIELAFEMEQSDIKPLSTWVHGTGMPLKELRSTVCLSLGCYSAEELRKSLQNNKPDDVPETVITKTIAALSSKWPQSGGLSMNVNLHGARKNLPLAPPFVVTGDGLVDVSEFVVVGKNIIQIHQRKDFTDYMFVLHAHRPTYKQLQRIVDRRKKEAEWKSWLTDIARPLDITLPSQS